MRNTVRLKLSLSLSITIAGVFSLVFVCVCMLICCVFSVVVRRVEFFQEAVSAAVSAAGESEPNTGSEFDVDLMHRLAAAYMSRHDEELSQLGSARRAGRSASSREVALRGVVQEETEELRGGFWMPDLREEGTVENLKAWDGGWSSLGRMRFVRVADDGKGGIGARESRFPPNGLS